MKRSIRTAITTDRKVLQTEAFDNRKVDVTRFKPDISNKKWAELLRPLAGAWPLPTLFFPIETLSVAKTIGKGRTNLTFIRPTIVQADAATPHASFDLQASPTRNPTIQMHFEPGAYGFTSAGTYVMSFSVEVDGEATFDLQGGPATLPTSNTGTKVLAGKTTVSLIFGNLAPSDQVYGYLEQTSGGRWTWFGASVRLPLPIFQPA